MGHKLIHTSLLCTSFTLGGCGPKDPPITDDTSGGESTDMGTDSNSSAATSTSTGPATTDTDPTMPTTVPPVTTTYSTYSTYDDTGCPYALPTGGCPPYYYTTAPYTSYPYTTTLPDTESATETATTIDTDCGGSGTLGCTFTSGESGDPCGTTGTGGCPDTDTGTETDTDTTG